MKLKNLLLTGCLSLGLTACGGGSDEPETPTPEPDPTPSPTPEPAPTPNSTTFYKGADISWVTEMEKKGHKFYNSKGEERECTALMKELGLNAIRLRVWVNPTDKWCNKEDVLVKAQRAANLGMDIMIDFHYSDSWADPSKQNIPAAWKSHSYEEMKKDVKQHTKEVLELLKKNNITPKWVQIGNETSNGFLWEVGQADKNPKQYAGLFAAGYEAAKSVFSDITVIVHLDNGFDNSLYNWNLDILKNNGAKWDMIGMSLYPYWAALYNNMTASKVISQCIDNIKKVSNKYNCDVMIVETGMECADGNGKLASSSVLENGKTLLTNIIKECKENTNERCKGVFYWEPECQPSQYKLGAFTENGKPTVIMDAFKD
ncbi:MAG: glycosyl hydrolase 53 family protein [Bacteroides sp.]|nr:glycosyl hydrolase 53 family protein [Bacteroides sp.]